jgi:drug/metabolite transporter (DMT)-like permease
MPATVPFFAHSGGELTALLVGLFWAFSATAFSRISKNMPVLEVNLLRTAMAAALMGVAGLLLGEPLLFKDPIMLGLFFLSGLVAIGIGDTAYLAGMTHIGVRNLLLITTLAPPLTALLAIFFLGEHISLTAWLGILVTVSGVAWVITEQGANGNGRTAHNWRRGVAYGLVTALSQACSSILSRAGFARGETGSLQAALVRLLAAVLFLAVFMMVSRYRPGGWRKASDARRNAGFLVLGMLAGPLIGSWMLQYSLKAIPAGVVQTLVATGPLFATGLAALSGEKITLRSVVGALVALLGVAMLFGLVG